MGLIGHLLSTDPVGHFMRHAVHSGSARSEL